ncbi:MAG: glycoside hydrolase family 88 protein [Bacteroidales bacterium]
MNRRKFFETSSAAGILTLGSAGIYSCSPGTGDSAGTDLPGSVIHAMLSIQRRSWEQGVCAQALMEAGYKKLTLLMAEEAVLRQDAQGRLGNVASDEAVTDPASNGEPVLFAFHETNNQAYRQAADKMLDFLLHKAPRTRDGVIHHIANAPQLWIDSMYMSPPFIAVAGNPAEAVRQVEGYRKYLWDPSSKLFSHIWDEGKNDFIRKDFWGVGNGWAAAGMVRVAAALPEDMQAEKERLIGFILELVDGCMKYLRDDGFFHNVVNNPETFIETNLSQMLSYTIFRCVKYGWMSDSFLPAAEKMRNAALSKVDEYGMIRDVCGSPNFDRPGAAAEGQAFHLLMEAAWNDLGKR